MFGHNKLRQEFQEPLQELAAKLKEHHDTLHGEVVLAKAEVAQDLAQNNEGIKQELAAQSQRFDALRTDLQTDISKIAAAVQESQKEAVQKAARDYFAQFGLKPVEGDKVSLDEHIRRVQASMEEPTYRGIIEAIGNYGEPRTVNGLTIGVTFSIPSAGHSGLHLNKYRNNNLVSDILSRGYGSGLKFGTVDNQWSVLGRLMRKEADGAGTQNDVIINLTPCTKDHAFYRQLTADGSLRNKFFRDAHSAVFTAIVKLRLEQPSPPDYSGMSAEAANLARVCPAFNNLREAIGSTELLDAFGTSLIEKYGSLAGQLMVPLDEKPAEAK